MKYDKTRINTIDLIIMEIGDALKDKIKKTELGKLKKKFRKRIYVIMSKKHKKEI